MRKWGLPSKNRLKGCILVLIMYNIDIQFEYDPLKSEANRLKHGLSLDEIKILWQVPAVEVQARTSDEPRFMRIGKIEGKYYSCVYTLRGRSVRLISGRASREDEKQLYEDIIRHEKNHEKENRSREI